MPPVGDSDQGCEQARQAFRVHLTVAPTPNPNFRRVDAQVFSGEAPILRLSTVMGNR
jgi:general secretion pathway protein I